MKTLHELLPEKISDEGAYHLVNFFMDLAFALETHYFSQMMKYVQNNTPTHLPECLRKKSDNENNF